jgi:cation diffusion facilitator family transporter
MVVKEMLFRYTFREGRRIHSHSVMANAWHHRSDAFSSVATLIGVSAATFIPSLRMLDAYAAMIVAFIIVKVGSEIAWKAGVDIVDTAPHREVREKIAGIVIGVDGVLLIHDLNTRYFGRYILADVHVEVDPGISVSEGHNIATRAKEEVMAAIPEVMNLLVHVEPAGDFRARHTS